MLGRHVIAVGLLCLLTATPADAQDPPIPVVSDKDLVGRWLLQTGLVEGNKVKDLAGDLDGTITGPVNLQPVGKLQALVTDGLANSVLLAADHNTAGLPTEKISVEAWVRVDQPTEWGGIIGAIQDNGNFERGWLLGYNHRRFCFALCGKDGPGRLTYMKTRTDFQPGRWYHVVGTYDGGEMKLYVDGELQGGLTEQKGPINYPPKTFFEIGAYHDNNEYYRLAGMIHEIRLYRRALSAEEVKQHHQAKQLGSPPVPTRQSPTALPRAPAHIVANAPEAAGYRLVYQAPLTNHFDPTQYVVNNSEIVPDESFDRIAYYVELESDALGKQFVWVSMDAFTTDAGLIGVPKTAAHLRQMQVGHMNVISNVSSITNAADFKGNIEFWTTNYGGDARGVVPGGAGTYDFDDTKTRGGNYGSMQVHNFGAKQTLFAYNHWNDNSVCDLGIGNRPESNPDWTFSGSGNQYTVKNLYVLIAPSGPTFIQSPMQLPLKYLYGQCISNLDRRPGGVWAEMVEDRKFFRPVGQADSPWQKVSATTALAMDTDKPFVGKHSPRFALSGNETAGMVQSGLTLEAGRSYVGRIVLAGTPEVGPIRVKLIWGFGQDGRQVVPVENLTETYRAFPLKFTAGATVTKAKLEISATGKGTFRVGAISLMPEDNVEGFRKDALRWLRILYTPIYRWPGGEFLNGYNWKEGIGDCDRRPPRLLASSEIDQNDVGIDEFLVFCRLLAAEGCVALNTSPGDRKSAAELVQYCNGSSATSQGRLRTQNGHPKPYRVTWWEIGAGRRDPPQAEDVPVQTYVEEIKKLAAAMSQADPSIRIIAAAATGTTSEAILQGAGNRINLIGEQLYGEHQNALPEHVSQLADAIGVMATAYGKYQWRLPAMKNRGIALAIDEWNYAYGPEVWGERNTRFFLQDALGVAVGLNELIRQKQIVSMAYYAQTDRSLGCIKTTKTASTVASTGLVLKLYRQRFGVLPVKMTCDPPLDVAAAFTKDRKQLTIAVVNPTAEREVLPIAISGVTLTGSGTRWRIGGGDPRAVNQPGQPLKVTVHSSLLEGVARQLQVPPYSVTVVALDAVLDEE